MQFYFQYLYNVTYRASFVFWVSLAQLVSWGSVFYGFALFMGPVETDLNMTRSESSLGFSLALLMEGLMAYPVGRLIDRGHERLIMTFGSFLMILGLILHSQIQSPLHFYIVWIMLGAGMSGTLYPPIFTVITRRFPTDFRKAIITLTFLGGLASTVFIPLISWAISYVGWRYSLWILAGFNLLICLPIHSVMLKDAPKSIVDLKSQEDPLTLKKHLRSPVFLLLGVFMVLLLAVQSALPAHLVSLLRESGLKESWSIWVPASIGLLQVGGRLILFFFESELNVHQVNRWIPCLVVFGLITLLLGGGQPIWALVFVVSYGVGNGMITIVKGTAIAEYVSRPLNGSLNGALGIPLAFGRASAPWLMGVLWSVEAGYSYGLFLMVIFGVVGIAALWLAQHQALKNRQNEHVLSSS